MKYTILFILSFFIVVTSFSQKKYSNEYEVDFIKTENGKVYCTIFTYCKNEKQCLENAKINAIKKVAFLESASPLVLGLYIPCATRICPIGVMLSKASSKVVNAFAHEDPSFKPVAK